jgi:hypothetical protein
VPDKEAIPSDFGDQQQIVDNGENAYRYRQNQKNESKKLEVRFGIFRKGKHSRRPRFEFIEKIHVYKVRKQKIGLSHYFFFSSKVEENDTGYYG